MKIGHPSLFQDQGVLPSTQNSLVCCFRVLHNFPGLNVTSRWSCSITTVTVSWVGELLFFMSECRCTEF